jgi:hypothetical protein
MKLAEYVEQTYDATGGSDYHWSNIMAFEIGDVYVCHMYDGSRISFDDLDVLLNIIHSEFEAAGDDFVPLLQYDPSTRLTDKDYARRFRKDVAKVQDKAIPADQLQPRAAPLVQSNNVSMLVLPAIVSPGLAMPPLSYFMDQIRVAVTQYTLSGSWTAQLGNNL